jgi:two-component system response regulator YesN
VLSTLLGLAAVFAPQDSFGTACNITGDGALTLILSGYAEFAYAQNAIRLGVSEYLLKPVTISQVRDLLQKMVLGEKPPEEQASEELTYSPVIARMVEEIRSSYAKKLGLESFAEKYHMTPQYLSNLFTKEMGKTFSEYLRQVRIERAKELLRTTDMKIYEVACAVGYPDQKYFSKVFREYTNISAKQYAMMKTDAEGEATNKQ